MRTNHTQTKDGLSFSTLLKPTTTSQSERLLADSLGYPKSWHVVRKLIISNSNSDPTAADSSANTQTCQDIIYAGNPNAKVDVYFNHIAAMEAALSWTEGESSGWDNKGGQLLPLVAGFVKGETVEVFYEPEDSWYEATIVKVKMSKDDVRYTVHYTEEDTTQTNVSEDVIRKVDSSSLKGKKGKGQGKTSTSPTRKKVSDSDSKKRKTIAKDEEEDSIPTKKPNKRTSSSYVPKPEELQLAQSMGLPEGWAAKSNGKGMYSFRSPDGQTRIEGKRAVFKHLGMDKPRNFYPRSSKSTKVQYKEPDDEDMMEEEEEDKEEQGDDDNDDEDYDQGHRKVAKSPTKKTTPASNKKAKRTRAPKEDEFWEEEEGDDPPWRITGHEFIGKKIDVDSNIGLIVGWIAETDVDKNGQPGYVSESDGKPAALFHVQFETHSALETQDFEEFEVLNYLLQGKKSSSEEEEEE